jgi:quinoprotein glucose dehydrogenase
MRIDHIALSLVLAGAAQFQPARAQTPSPPASAIEWPAYGHDPGGTRFSPASRIDRSNVAQLAVAWVYRTGDMLVEDRQGHTRGRFETTPLVVDGTLYLTSPVGAVMALNPATGAERWRYDPRIDLGGDYGDFANRGVSTWLDPRRSAGACRRRIFVAPVDARLIALDAATGRPCGDFGRGGQVDLKPGAVNQSTFQGEYEITSPPAVIGDLVIVGSAISDNQRVNAPSGIVRAYDARTGALRWSWDPIPRSPGMPGYDTWRGTVAHTTGAANAWSAISVDAARGLAFIPVGSASPDFYGGERLGQNLYSNAIVALHVRDGSIAWYFQVVHHDLWDYDVPAQPVLITLPLHGKLIAAVAVATKMGHLYILDRDSGKPLLPVEERAVPHSDLPGEESWPTQPFPVRPAPLTPEQLTATDAWGVTPEERAACRDRIASLRFEGTFTPPSARGTIIFPGNIGGSYWAGVAWDSSRALLVSPTNRVAMVVHETPRDSMDHGGAIPNAEIGPQRGTPYVMQREMLLSAKGVPCNPPPWGALVAIDLKSADKKWEAPLGWLPKLSAQPEYKRWGSINLGGAILTGGGLVFASGGRDEFIHAFDVESGRELWNAPLPAGGNAMPMTYQTATGKQFVVIAAGGHDRLGTSPGDYLVAYSLPDPAAPAPVHRAPRFGSFDGELHVDRWRFPGAWTITQRGDSVSGGFVGDSASLNGDFTGSFTNDTLRIAAKWEIRSRQCTGDYIAVGTFANHDQMIVGTFLLHASCGEHDEHGTFALRRPPAEDHGAH